MQRKRASDFDPRLLELYDGYVHGKLTRRGFIDAAGKITVAEQGRNQGNAGGFAGPSINRRTGLTSLTKSGAVRRTRGARARRWNGVTQGKNTASDALAAIEPKVPKLVNSHVGRAIRKTF